MWLVGVASRRWVWLVGVGGIYGCGWQEVGVGGIYGCGCKMVYRFPHIHIPYPYSSCICSFLQHPFFCSFLNVFRSL